MILAEALPHMHVSKLRQKTISAQTGPNAWFPGCGGGVEVPNRDQRGRIANPLVEVNLAEAASRQLPCTFALVTDEDVLSVRRDTKGSGFSPRLPYSIV
jgi:hypothetical protein